MRPRTSRPSPRGWWLRRTRHWAEARGRAALQHARPRLPRGRRRASGPAHEAALAAVSGRLGAAHATPIRRLPTSLPRYVRGASPSGCSRTRCGRVTSRGSARSGRTRSAPSTGWCSPASWTGPSRTAAPSCAAVAAVGVDDPAACVFVGRPALRRRLRCAGRGDASRARPPFGDPGRPARPHRGRGPTPPSRPCPTCCRSSTPGSPADEALGAARCCAGRGAG